MKKNLTFEQAFQQLEQCVQDVEGGQLSIDCLASKVKEAQSLAKFCHEKLIQVEKDIQEIMPKEDN